MPQSDPNKATRSCVVPAWVFVWLIHRCIGGQARPWHCKNCNNAHWVPPRPFHLRLRRLSACQPSGPAASSPHNPPGPTQAGGGGGRSEEKEGLGGRGGGAAGKGGA